MKAIEIADVRKRYKSLQALKGVSLSVEQGEFFGLLGPNGAGKSTLMRILCSVLGPTSGTARIEGFDVVTESLEVRRRVGYLPESAPLYPEMTPGQYLEFMARVRRVPADAVDRAVERCGIGDVIHRPVAHLSKGYRQRVGLAQAILHWPPILILDEPTTGLDPSQIAEIRSLIREIGRERTVILSSHILPEVEATCDRVVIIDRGRLRAGGTPAELSREAVGGQRLRLELDGVPAEEAAAVLRELEAVHDAGVDDDGRVTLTADDDIRAEIFRAVVDHGWTLLELHSEVRSLESVYLEVTGTADKGDHK